MEEAKPAAAAATVAACDVETASPGSIKAVVTLDISMSDVPPSASGAALLMTSAVDDIDSNKMQVDEVSIVVTGSVAGTVIQKQVLSHL
jgi:hypothetical protein